MTRAWITCFVLCLALSSCSAIPVGIILKLIDTTYKIGTNLLERNDVIESKEQRLMYQIDQVSVKVEAIKNSLTATTDSAFEAMVSQLPKGQMLESSMHDLWKYIGQVDNSYQNFLHYAKAPQKYEQYTMEDFAKNAVSSSLNALPDVLKMIHRLVVPPNWDVDIFHRSILTLLAKNMQVLY